VIRPLSGERGQVLTWIAVFLPALLVVLGLVVDGGLAFAARRDLQGLADAAAHAGAMQIDTTTYAATGQVQLSPDHARTAAEEYLSMHAGITSTIVVGPTWVRVTVGKSWPTVFLRLFGVRSVTMSATATAHARVGY
jgi:uncharacterized membrane protein